jgi:hypothetical protein
MHPYNVVLEHATPHEGTFEERLRIVIRRYVDLSEKVEVERFGPCVECGADAHYAFTSRGVFILLSNKLTPVGTFQVRSYSGLCYLFEDSGGHGEELLELLGKRLVN